MTLELLGELLVPIIGIGLSPIPIIAVILVLATKEADKNGRVFAVGWLIGLSILVLVATLLLSVVDFYGKDNVTLISWIRIGLGMGLLALAAKKWVHRPKSGREPTLPKWMATIDQITPRKSMTLGVTLGGVNPKNIAFTLVAVTSLVQAEMSRQSQVVWTVLFVVLSSLVLVGLVVVHTVATEQSTPALARIKTFMMKNNSIIMAILFSIFGVMLIQKGITGI